jgi:hypothetical protein
MPIWFQPQVISPGANGFGPQRLGRQVPVEFSIRESAGVAGNLNVTTFEGPQLPVPVPANSAFRVGFDNCLNFQLTGNGSSITIQVGTPGETIDPKNLPTTVSGAVNNTQVAVSSASRQSDYVYTFAIQSVPGTAFNCPTSTKVTILRIGIVRSAGSYSLYSLSGTSAIQYPIVSGAANWTLGPEPGCNVMNIDGIPLLPGDSIGTSGSNDISATVSLEILEEPL